MFREIGPAPDIDPVLRRVGLFLRKKRHDRAISQRTLSRRTSVP